MPPPPNIGAKHEKTYVANNHVFEFDTYNIMYTGHIQASCHDCKMIIICHQNPTKDNGATLSVIKIVKYCDVWGGGRSLGGGGAHKSYKR